MDDFAVLEQRVRKAAEAVRRLRKQTGALEEDLSGTRARLEEAERRLAEQQESHEGTTKAARLRALTEEVEALRGERDEVRSRIARLVELLDGLES
jgi:chromosome segregation ATPase